MRTIRLQIIACLFLVAITLVAYRGVCGNEFLNYDDNLYVWENKHLIQEGLSWPGIRWAWTDFTCSMWNPLTRMSFLLDHALYGMNPWGYHFSNLLFHLANVLLLYAWLTRLTGAAWRSLVVAAFWAVHPLRVESVAWVTERKDVLSLFFGLISLWLYVGYARRPGALCYVGIVLAFTLSLLAKPMLVTLPVLLLLLDYWPLGRLRFASAAAGDSTAEESAKPMISWWRLLWEKLPLLAIAGAFALTTMVTHHEMGAMRDPLDAGFLHRCGNGMVAYLQYLLLTIWPHDLTIVYPYPYDSLSMAEVLGAGLILLGVALAAFRLAKSLPYLAVGWLWFLLTLLPVLGVVRNTMCAYADRYTYVPHIGLFVIVCWALADMLARWDCRCIGRSLAAGVGLVACIVGTQQQLPYWHDSLSLWGRALAVTSDNSTAHNNYGSALLKQPGRLAEAQQHFMAAWRINPRSRSANVNMAIAYSLQRNLPEAVKYFSMAIDVAPDYAFAHGNLGMALLHLGKLAEAEQHLAEAVRINPEFGDAYLGRGLALARMGRHEEAYEQFAAGARLEPDNPKAHSHWGAALLVRGDEAAAREHLEKAIQLDPLDAESQMNLGLVLGNQGLWRDAERCLKEALERQPNYGEAHFNLGVLLERQGRAAEAELHLGRAVELLPECAEVFDNLGAVLEVQGKSAEAQRCYEYALRLKPDLLDARCNLASILYGQGRTEDAAREYDAAARFDSGWLNKANAIAVELANEKDPQRRNPREALRLGRQVCEATAYQKPEFLQTLASCYAAAAQWKDAIETARKALKLATAQPQLLHALESNLKTYESQQGTSEQPPYSEGVLFQSLGSPTGTGVSRRPILDAI
jgi:tetratricopeptide (TPR) repeat protein